MRTGAIPRPILIGFHPLDGTLKFAILEKRKERWPARVRTVTGQLHWSDATKFKTGKKEIMKINTTISGESTRVRRQPPATAFNKLLTIGLTLLGMAWGFRAAAQFPSAPENEHTNSLGVVRIDTTTSTLSTYQLSELFGQNDAMYAYPGWNPPFLTSPLLIDPDTCIATGGASRRLISSYDGNTSYPLGFPQTVGATGVSAPPLSLPLTADTITSYSDYGGFLPVSGDFSSLPPINTGPREVLTEIQAINLASSSVCTNGCDPRVPCLLSYASGADTTMVRAGYDNIYHGGQAFPTTANIGRSLGMIDSQSSSGLSGNDFPANSFFDIYPEITLPAVNNTVSATHNIFTVGNGAVLTTGPYPLIIEAKNLPGPTLPPSVVYIHQTTDFGVDLIFRDTGPTDPNTGQPYWSAGDVLGTIVLAGHNPGVVNPCAKSSVVSDFLDAVLGPVGQLAPTAVLGLLYDNDNFPPSSSSSYASTAGTNFDGSSIDSVQFTNGVTTLYVRDFNFDSFSSPIALPAFGSSVTYSNTNTAVSLQLSTDGLNFFSGSATGAVQILIVNTNPPTAPSKTYYYAELTSFSGAGSSLAGSFKFRESPTKASPGLLIVQTNNAAGNFKIGGYLNTSFEWSFNGGISYVPANRPIQLKLLSAVNCGSVSPKMTIVMVSPGIAQITWDSSNYRLQSSPSLSPAVWTDIPATSPYIFNVSSSTTYYRLTCP